MSLGSLPEATLERLGDYTFVTCDGVGHSLSSLVDRAARVAGSLVAQGISPGDRVGVVMANSPEVLVASFAIWRIGAAVMPVIPAVTPAELGHILTDSGAKAVFASTATAGLVTSAVPDQLLLGEGTPLPFGRLEAAEPAAVVPRRDDDLAALLYTGGTTGRAKGVMLTAANLVAVSQARQQVVEAAGTRSVLVRCRCRTSSGSSTG